MEDNELAAKKHKSSSDYAPFALSRGYSPGL
jgi:hypothetical protein